MEIKTQIIVNAPPNKVWAVLMDFENYPDWNSFIKRITGKPKVGGQILVSIVSPEGRHMTFKPTVLVFEHNKEFRWLGKLWFKGVFDGEHTFELVDNGNGTTIFNHSETFRGLLVSLFKKQLEISTRSGFERMNSDLKQRVESQVHV
ncbi:SRPBCC domain-containing protein [Muricauda oceani]|uniref:SRPBCC domain-containing protein n=1 Tax=Flagellimonas oceani TaxID=2698672 RepID=A0A6G7J0D5_9FLAO|nr:SRPBCC domain-containing protein [Allomuricauda oceani]MBW8243679.1 SRPBCC domain-containing protein [Allomuricauda oceani]QII43957.1 SRPBCC domain-containing protein [Allomuricauda oceani]